MEATRYPRQIEPKIPLTLNEPTSQVPADFQSRAVFRGGGGGGGQGGAFSSRRAKELQAMIITQLGHLRLGQRSDILCGGNHDYLGRQLPYIIKLGLILLNWVMHLSELCVSTH